MSNSKYESNRSSVDFDEARNLELSSNIFLDEKRTRPLWYDGRFAKASDFNHQTEYFLSRQSDMAVATGTGVVEGLSVSFSINNNRLKIQAGFGVTSQGKRVVVGNDATINLNEIDLIRSINSKLKLSAIPKPPLNALNGVYAVLLRPLEFTSNPIASYPTDVDNQRSLNDGDIIEATAVSLVELSIKNSVSADQYSARRDLANDIFQLEKTLGIPENTLPLAVIEVSNGVINWADNNLVRRDMGASFSDVLGFGIVPRVLRHAHFKQYDEMYTDIVQQSGRNNFSFPADQYFSSIPSAGKMPVAAVNMKNKTQTYFPENMDVDITVIPEDEVAALLEESLLLPPVVLNGTEDEEYATSIMVLVPVPRLQFPSLLRSLKNKIPVVKVSNKNANKNASINAVKGIQKKLHEYAEETAIVKEDVDDVEWNLLVKNQKNLWYVRRRHLSYREEVAGKVVNVLGDEFSDETTMRKKLRDIELYDDFTYLKVKGSAAADLGMVRLLTIPKFTRSEILMRSALVEYKGIKKLSEKEVNKVNDRFSEPEIGTGIERIEKSLDLNTEQVIRFAKSKRTPEIDAIARSLPKNSLDQFTEDLKKIIVKKDSIAFKEIDDLVSKRAKDFQE